MTLFPLGELFSFIQTIVKRSLKECFAAWIAPQRSQSLGTLGERIERPQNGAISTSWCGNVTRKIEKANAENHNTSNEKRLLTLWLLNSSPWKIITFFIGTSSISMGHVP
jgi:hypothetical protein